MPRRWNTYFLPRLDDYRDLVGAQSRLISIIVIITILSTAPVGYHVIALNVPTETIKVSIEKDLYLTYGITVSKAMLDFIWSFIVACQSIGALLGCVFVVPLGKKFGTKTALMVVNNVVLIVASVLFLLSGYFYTFLFLVIARLLIGVFTGIVCALVPIFIQELAPTRIKGMLGCFVHIAVCLGSAVGSLLSIDEVLGSDDRWHFLLAGAVVFGIVEMGVARYLPDTPDFCLSAGEKGNAAASINFYYALDRFDTDIALAEYQQLVVKLPQQITFLEALSDKSTRQGIALGMIVSATQIFSGTMAAVSYSTSMFTSVALIGFIVPLVPFLGSLLSIVLTIPALRFVETCGRRGLLINTLALCALANYLLVVFSLASERLGDGNWASFAFFVSFLLLGIGYNVGSGPVAYFIPSELVPPNAVGVAMGMAVASNWFCNIFVLVVFYPLQASIIGGWSYLMFAVPTTLFILIIYKYLPETVSHSNAYESDLILSCNLPFDNRYGTFVR